MLRSCAAANFSAGGRVAPPERINEAIEWLRDFQAATQFTSIEKRRLGDAGWDHGLYLIQLCDFMSVDWSLRKVWQLP